MGHSSNLDGLQNQCRWILTAKTLFAMHVACRRSLGTLNSSAKEEFQVSAIHSRGPRL